MKWYMYFLFLIIIIIGIDLLLYPLRKKVSVPSFMRFLYWEWIRIKNKLWRWFIEKVIKLPEGEKYNWFLVILFHVIHPRYIFLLFNNIGYDPYLGIIKLNGVSFSLRFLEILGKSGFKTGTLFKIIDRNNGDVTVRQYGKINKLNRAESFRDWIHGREIDGINSPIVKTAFYTGYNIGTVSEFKSHSIVVMEFCFNGNHITRRLVVNKPYTKIGLAIIAHRFIKEWMKHY